MKQYHNFTLKDVESLLQLKTWWAVFAVLPIANRLVVVIANHSKIRPNTISIIALVARLVAGICFLSHQYISYILGALFYYTAYTLDCVDGPVARLTNQTSEFGRYLDHLSDLFGDIFILCCLAYSQNLLLSVLIFSMVFMHISECYISYLAGFAIEKNDDSDSIQSSPGIFVIFDRYRQWWFSRDMKSFFSYQDYAAFVFILAPVSGYPRIGLYIGFCLLLATTCYTVLSTFVSIHTGTKRFP